MIEGTGERTQTMLKIITNSAAITCFQKSEAMARSMQTRDVFQSGHDFHGDSILIALGVCQRAPKTSQ